MIADARIALGDVLTGAGFRVFNFVPPNITPPCAVIMPAAEWVVGGENFAEYRIGFEVRIFAQAVTNEVATDYIDQQAENLVVAITDADNFYLATVSNPDMYSENGSTYLGIAATIYQIARI